MRRRLRSIRGVAVVLSRRGFRYAFYLLFGYLTPRLIYQYGYGANHSRSLLALADQLDRWLMRLGRAAVLRAAGSTPVTSATPLSCRADLPLPVPDEARSTSRRDAGGFCCIGRLNAAGEMVGFEKAGRIGPAAETGDVRSEIVSRGDEVLLKKTYGSRTAFAHAWLAAARLGGRMRVPALCAVDARRKALYLDLVRGTPTSPSDLGRANSLAAAEALVNLVHAAGVTGIRHAAGNLVISPEDGSVWFADLPLARAHRKAAGPRFAHERDCDRREFNERFAAGWLTEAEARAAVVAERTKIRSGYRDYAPIDFGGGIATGQIASTDSGTGRWEFFNRQVVAPLVESKRVLDLGSNNGSLPLMMLRAGAHEVVAVESSAPLADVARLNGRVLAWRDMREYRLTVHTADMRRFTTDDWGRFDVVTAFCSLYYLPENAMAQIVRTASSMGAVLILQANNGADNPAAQHTYLQRLMEENGYPRVQIHTWRGFLRPLLVGVAAPDSNVGRENTEASAAIARSL